MNYFCNILKKSSYRVCKETERNGHSRKMSFRPVTGILIWTVHYARPYKLISTLSLTCKEKLIYRTFTSTDRCYSVRTVSQYTTLLSTILTIGSHSLPWTKSYEFADVGKQVAWHAPNKADFGELLRKWVSSLIKYYKILFYFSFQGRRVCSHILSIYKQRIWKEYISLRRQ
jgi:cellulose synthase/poly-beta-1,6-N-acetylglucosamine synthase-like glycosyltransferase